MNIYDVEKLITERDEALSALKCAIREREDAEASEHLAQEDYEGVREDIINALKDSAPDIAETCEEITIEELRLIDARERIAQEVEQS